MKCRHKSVIGFLIYIIFLEHGAFSQGPPIFTDTPIMLGLEGRGIRTFGNIIIKENGNAYIQPVVIPYNVTAKWQIGASVAFVSKSPEGMSSQSGFGDMKVFTKYQLYQKDGKGRTLRSLVKLTQTFPTGNSTEEPTLGSGVYQTTLSLVNGYVTTKYGVYGEVGYNVAYDGLPDNFIYNIAFGYPLLPQKYPPSQLNLYLELNGNYIIEGAESTLYLSPGIQYIVGRRVLFESGIQLPLDETVPKNQQTKFILRLGTRILIF